MPDPRRAWQAPPGVRFGDLAFSGDFAQARRDDGGVVRFTRAERRVLLDLTTHAGVLRSRGQILDTLTEAGSDASDRNVDFVIARLRAKLADNARQPAFIATRYGEGYVWIASEPQIHSAVIRAFLVIGPIRGLGDIGEAAPAALAFAERIADVFRSEMSPDRTVVVEPDCPPLDHLSDAAPDLQLALTFLETDGRLDCVSVFRRSLTGMVLAVRRDRDVGNPDAAGRAASESVTALWMALAKGDDLAGLQEAPLAIRLYEAAGPFIRGKGAGEVADLPPEAILEDGETFPLAEHWRRNEIALRRLLATGKADAAARLMLAVNIQSRYVTHGWQFLANDDPRARDEAEIQDLLLPVLPELLANPMHAMAAANVLFFLGREYRASAVDIAEQAFRSSTELGHSLTTLGGILIYSADFERGFALLRQARRFAKPRSMFDRMIQTYVCIGHLAAGDFAAKDMEIERLATSALSKGPYRLLFADPGSTDLSLAAHLHLRLMPAKYARSTLLWSYYIGARLFTDPTAQENVILGFAGHLRRRFGDRVVHPEVAAAIPAILEARRPARAPDPKGSGR
jgi:DNA-binding winged helix-turn-helix (wHTH) protein